MAAWLRLERALTEETTYSVAEAMAAQGELRRALGLGAERFSLPALIGMLSDEIEQLRAVGRSDAEIVGMIGHAIGHTIAARDLTRFYAPPDARRRPE